MYVNYLPVLFLAAMNPFFGMATSKDIEHHRAHCLNSRFVVLDVVPPPRREDFAAFGPGPTTSITEIDAILPSKSNDPNSTFAFIYRTESGHAWITGRPGAIVNEDQRARFWRTVNLGLLKSDHPGKSQIPLEPNLENGWAIIRYEANASRLRDIGVEVRYCVKLDS
jgi:hypothetical protein